MGEWRIIPMSGVAPWQAGRAANDTASCGKHALPCFAGLPPGPQEAVFVIHNLTSRQHRNYRTIPIETLQDSRLSTGAHRVLMFLLSQDTMYSVNYVDLQALLGLEYRAVLRLINELVELEYVERECHVDPNDKGRFFWTFTVYSLPKAQFYSKWRAAKEQERKRRLRRADDNTFDVAKELWGKG